MPCNLTARADAKISNQVLAKLLTPEIVGNALAVFVEQRNTYASLSIYSNAVHAYVGEFAVTIREGQVDVSGTRNNQAACKQLADAITAHLARVAGLLLQQQIKNTLATKFAIESAQMASNGAMVLTVEI